MLNSSRMLLLLFLFSFATLTWGQSLQAGDKAPDFKVKTVSGQYIQLSHCQEEKVLLSFFRHLGSPTCHFRLQQLITDYQELQANGITIIAIFESDEKSLQDFLIENPVPFPLIADPHSQLYASYRLEKSLGKALSSMTKTQYQRDRKAGKAILKGKNYPKTGKGNRISADFIIEKGVILEAHYGQYIGDHLPMYRIHQY